MQIHLYKFDTIQFFVANFIPDFPSTYFVPEVESKKMGKKIGRKSSRRSIISIGPRMRSWLLFFDFLFGNNA